MDIANIKYIYYQGISTDCNYDCSYCNLEKSKNYNAWDDERYLYKFVNYMRKAKFYQPVSVMFTPHGEVLNKEHYLKAIAKLTQSENVALVSCQTNGSFIVKDFLLSMKKYNANMKKLSLWITFHPETVGGRIYDFANKLIELSSKINISVGVVGLKEYRSEIATLHNIIPPRVHYWINKPESLKTQKSELFDKIDKNFHLENKAHKCDINSCSAGIISLVVKEKGDVYLCRASKKIMGNLYDVDAQIVREKSATKCDSYLTYSQKRDISFPRDIHKFRHFKDI